MRIYCNNQTRSGLDKFIDKDIWVKVHDSTFPISNPQYLKILSRDKGWYIGMQISAYFVEDAGMASYFTYREIRDVFKSILTEPERICVDYITLYKPVECYNSEELFNLIEENMGLETNWTMFYMRKGEKAVQTV